MRMKKTPRKGKGSLPKKSKIIPLRPFQLTKKALIELWVKYPKRIERICQAMLNIGTLHDVWESVHKIDVELKIIGLEPYIFWRKVLEYPGPPK